MFVFIPSLISFTQCSPSIVTAGLPGQTIFSLSCGALCTPMQHIFGCGPLLQPAFKVTRAALERHARLYFYFPGRTCMARRRGPEMPKRCLLMFAILRSSAVHSTHRDSRYRPVWIQQPLLTGLSRLNKAMHAMLPLAASYNRTTVDAALSAIPWLKRSRYLVYRLGLQ